MLKISVVIPTLQKNLLFLENLLASLDKDTCVDEIIVIDNSCKGLDYKSDKLSVFEQTFQSCTVKMIIG